MFLEIWANYHICANMSLALKWHGLHLPVQAENCVTIMHQVHVHFLHIFMFHHIEGEEIHPWKNTKYNAFAS